MKRSSQSDVCFFTMLVSSSMRPSSRNLASPSQWFKL
jgi:hypothetical protein